MLQAKVILLIHHPFLMEASQPYLRCKFLRGRFVDNDWAIDEFFCIHALSHWFTECNTVFNPIIYQPKTTYHITNAINQIYTLTINYRFDVDTQFSPPAHDDSFFYIRYPIGDSKKSATAKTLTHALSEADIKVVQAAKPIVHATSKDDFAKHTEPCKIFLNAKEGKCFFIIIIFLIIVIIDCIYSLGNNGHKKKASYFIFF